MIEDALLQRAAKLSTATLHEAAGRIGALPHVIKPSAPGMRLCGRAFPVRSPAGDNLWIHRAVYAAAPGDILVIDVNGGHGFGYWGEILSAAAAARRLGGMVIDGGVRDGAVLAGVGFPVFSRELCIRGTGKDFGGAGHLNAPVILDGVVVSPGDLILGDSDGVVCIPAAQAESAVEASIARDAGEVEILARLQAGETTLDIFGLNR
jgi:4-hydroxy-4-methyl-2-oxoglutarate aldolase